MAIKGFRDSSFRYVRFRQGEAPSVMEEHAQLYADQSTRALRVLLSDGTDVDLSTIVSGPVVLQGGYDASTNTPDLVSPAAGEVHSGYSWVVETGGSAFFSHGLEVGDMLIARVNDPSLLGDWIILERDLSGVVTAAAPLGTGNFVSGADGTQKAEDSGYSAASFAAASHNHAATDVNSGTLDGDRLPAMSTTKKGGVPATGTPSGLFLKDDGSWAAVGATPGGDDTELQYNNSGAFGGLSDVTVGSGTLVIGGTRKLLPQGTYATCCAIGDVTTSSGDKGVAIGYHAKSSAINAIAIGSSANGSYSNAIALGRQATASGVGSIAFLGIATGSGAVAISGGPDSKSHAYGNWSLAICRQAYATQERAIAIGRGSQAYAIGSAAIGSEAQVANAAFTKAMAIGYGASVGAAYECNLSSVFTRIKHGTKFLVETDAILHAGSIPVAGYINMVIDGVARKILYG